MQDVPPTARCATCSACCRFLPGQFVPADLGPDVETRKAKARELLATGDYSIDWYEGDPRHSSQATDDDWLSRVEHLRPATTIGRGKIFDPSWGGGCVMLKADGCSLPRDERPAVCKALVPSEGTGPCRGMTKQELAMMWLDDAGWLEELGEQMVREASE